MTKKKSTDDTYDENSEASKRFGVRPKGTRAPPVKGRMNVTYKKEGASMTMLSKYQLAVLVTDTVAGLAFIYYNVGDPTYQAHMMWAFGLSHVIAMVPVFFSKRE